MSRTDGTEGVMVKLSEEWLGNLKVGEARKVETVAAQERNGKSKE